MSVNMFWLSWCPVTESNCQPLITKQVLYHLTNRAYYYVSFQMVEDERIELSRRPCKGPRLPLHQSPNLIPCRRSTSGILLISAWTSRSLFTFRLNSRTQFSVNTCTFPCTTLMCIFKLACGQADFKQRTHSIIWTWFHNISSFKKMAEDRGLEPRRRFKATDGLANHSNTIMGVFRIAGTS